MAWYDVKASQYGTIIVNGYTFPSINESELIRWSDDLTYVSTYSYGYNLNGDLIPVDDEGIIQTAFSNGVAPLMVLSPINARGEYDYNLVYSVLGNAVARDRLIDNMVQTVMEENYYGVVINFGYISQENREKFIIFISKSTERLNRRGKLLIVSLRPKTYVLEQTDLLYEGIDYESLGLGANFIELQTYKWSSPNEAPRALSPVNKLRKELDFAITRIHPNGILITISNFGYDWTLPFVEGESSAEIVTNFEASDRAARFGAEIQYDETAQAPYYEYTDQDGFDHIVWFENTQSIRAKLELINDYGLAGVSVRTIMTPFPAFTEVLNELYTVYKAE